MLKNLGANAIVASACPKVIDEGSPDYGYNPAINAIVEWVREAFTPRCFPRALPVDDDGRVACTVVEALPGDPSCNCKALGRGSLDAGVSAAARAQLESEQLCGVAGRGSCDSLCLCELPQLSGADLDTCQTAVQPPLASGYCYLNAAPDETNVGNPELVRACTSDSRRLIRFTGGAPAPGAFVLVACDSSQAP